VSTDVARAEKRLGRSGGCRAVLPDVELGSFVVDLGELAFFNHIPDDIPVRVCFFDIKGEFRKFSPGQPG